MHKDAEIQAEVEALRARFPDTRALYREVCALLFFRYGITPTASRLYQHVRKGSMGVPAEVLAKFWEELRERARVEIDHPGLPQAVRQAAGQAVAALWEEATQAARKELSSLRAEAEMETQQALAKLEQAERSRAQLQTQVQTAESRLGQLESQLQELADTLEQERRSHTAALATAEALRQQVEQLRQEQTSSRQHFSAELEKGREAVQQAARRAEEAERRALRDMDQERTARAAVNKQLEAARARLADAERLHQAQALEANATQARLSAALDAARATAADASKTVHEQRTQLQQALESASRYQAEADTLRALMRQVKPAPRPLRKNRGAAGPGAR